MQVKEQLSPSLDLEIEYFCLAQSFAVKPLPRVDPLALYQRQLSKLVPAELAASQGAKINIVIPVVKLGVIAAILNLNRRLSLTAVVQVINT